MGFPSVFLEFVYLCFRQLYMAVVFDPLDNLEANKTVVMY